MKISSNKKELLFLMKDVALAFLPEHEKREIFDLILYSQRSSDEIYRTIKKYLIAKMKHYA